VCVCVYYIKLEDNRLGMRQGVGGGVRCGGEYVDLREK
jgi:hypothetical protein